MKVIHQQLIINRYIEYIKVDSETKNNNSNNNNNNMYLIMNAEIVVCFKWMSDSLILLHIANHYSCLLTLNMFICYELGPNIIKQINMFTHCDNDCSRLMPYYAFL
jgi:hypothetical protein